MRASIQKWGNSLAVRIPKAFADEAKLAESSLVELTLVDGNLVISPARKTKWTLDELLAGITDENLHDEVDFGPPVGKEVW
jgi:antitoxin MazE